MARNWRSVNPAKYAKKDNPLGAALEGFASVYVPAVMKQKELDERRAYEEEKERKARAAAAAKASKAQEAKDKKLAKDAKILAKQYSGSDNNGEALVFFTQQLQLTDGDVGDAMAIADRMIANGNLKFVTREVDKPLQGPDVPRDFPLTVSPEGKNPVSEFGNTGNPINAGNVGNFTSKLDEEGKETNAYKTEGDQMSEIFAPVSEEPAIPLPEEGIEITPFGQEEVKLDYDRLGSLDDIRRYEMEIKNEGLNLSEEALGIIADEKERLTEAAGKLSIDEKIDLAGKDNNELRRIQTALEGDDTPQGVAMDTVIGTLLADNESVNLADYLTGMGSVNATKERIKQIENDNSIDATTQASVLGIMRKHLEDLENDTKDLKLTDQEYFGTVNLGEKPTQIEFVLTESGEFYSPLLQKTFSQKEVQNPQSVESYKTMMGNATRLQDNAFAKMDAARTNVEDLLIRAKSLDDIVRTSDASVLTFIGGKASSIIQRLENEVGALDAYFRGTSDEEIQRTIRDIVAADAADTNTQDAMEKVGINADLYSRYQAQLIEFAFVYARTGLGQDRTTDQDFKAAMNVVAAGSSYPTFTKSLRDLVSKSYEIRKKEHDKYIERPDVQIAKSQPGAEQFYSSYLVPLDTYLGRDQSLQTTIGWMNQTVSVPEPSETPTEVEKPKTVGASVSAYKNGPNFANDAKTFANLPSDALKEQWIDMIAQRKNLPPQVIRDALSSYKGQ